MGNSLAEGWSDPVRQYSGVSGGRTTDASQRRPFLSIIPLWTFALLFQMTSSPQYGDGADTSRGDENGVRGSRTGTGTWRAVLRTGSTMLMKSDPFSWTP